MRAAAPHPRRLHTTIRHGDGWSAVALDGVVDEHNGLGDVVDQVRGPVVVVDAGSVARINSVGVRDWIHWVRALEGAGHRVVLVDPSPALMDQVNLVRDFAGGAWIASFMAPYYCERCDLEEDRRLDTRALLRSGAPELPHFPCGKPACAKTFDAVEDGYLAFLEDQEVPEDVDHLEAVVRDAREALGRGPAAATAAPLASPAPQVEPGATPPTGGASDERRSRSSDLIFVVILVALGGVLGGLVYLLLRLE